MIAVGDYPIFYSPKFLTTVGADPLLETDDAKILAVQSETGLDAAVPIFCQRSADPLGLLSGLYGEFPDLPLRSAILSHCWHCYDTRIGSFGKQAQVDALVDGLRAQALAQGVSYYGFVNVSDL